MKNFSYQKIIFIFVCLILVTGCRPEIKDITAVDEPKAEAESEKSADVDIGESFEIQTSQDPVLSEANITFQDVENAYQTIMALEKEVQNLPDNVESDKVQKLQENYREVLWEASKVARVFWQSNPDARQREQAKEYEKRWVTVLASSNHKLAEKRLSELVLQNLSDPTIASDEKYQIYLQAVQQAALRERENGILAMSRKLNSGTDQLIKKFPAQAKSIGLYFMPLKAFHVYKQTNDFLKISAKIEKEIGRLELDENTLEDAARTRLDYAAALFELRIQDKVRENLNYVLGLDISQDIKDDAQIAIHTVTSVLKAEGEQDEFIGKSLDFSYSLRDPKTGKQSNIDLQSLRHQANVLFFLSEVDRPTVQVLKDLLATLQTFQPDPIGIIYIPLRPLNVSSIRSAEGADSSASFLPDEQFVKKIDELNRFEPWFTVDISKEENIEQLKRMQVKVYPQLWLLDKAGKVSHVRASQKIQVYLFNLLRQQKNPIGSGSIFEQ